MKAPATDHILKFSLGFAVSVIVMILAVGRWQGQMETSNTMMFEKILNLRSDVKDLESDLEKLEDKFNDHVSHGH